MSNLRFTKPSRKAGKSKLSAKRKPDSGRCGIPARTLPPCDLEWGHDGDQHASAGDGFYARDYDEEHRRRQCKRGMYGISRVVRAALKEQP